MSTTTAIRGWPVAQRTPGTAIRSRFQVRISGETDHPFRLNPTTCFGGIRPGISVESDHLFR
jgi:hypothetical protein